MIKPRLRIDRELQRIKQRSYNPQEALLQEARRIIQYGHIHMHQSVPYTREPHSWPLEALEPGRIYEIDHIRKVCIKYRLRFLDLSTYQGDLPSIALRNMMALEKKIQKKPDYKIIAPASFFKLEDRDKDPLLFAQVAENKFYLVAKWGEDLSWSRKITSLPLRSLETFMITLTAFSAITTTLIPSSWLVRNEAFAEDIFYYRGLFFCWLMVASFFFLIFLGLTFRKNFNDADWDSRYFN